MKPLGEVPLGERHPENSARRRHRVRAVGVEFPFEVPAVAQPALARIAHTLRATARRTADVPDGDHALLARFVKHRDETAFRSLVNRHGKVVLSACRQVLADPADVDDAFQATFLVLLKKAKAVDATTPLAGWLFAVAHRLAVRCRADTTRRRIREVEAAKRAATARERTADDLSWREAAAVLHTELNALPDKYRLPLLLCGVQGLTRDEAAEQLGTTVGAVRGQLERGRSLLERRLAKRGVMLSAGLLAVLLGSSRSAGGPPAALIDLAVQAASGQTSSAAALAHGAFPMTTTLKQMVLPAVLMLGLLGGIGAGLRPPIATADDKKPGEKMDKPKPGGKDEPKKPDAKERTITGKVLGHDGKPVVAELQLVWQYDKTEPLGKTNADGTFQVRVPLKKKEYGGWLVAKVAGHGIDFIMHGMDYKPETMTPTAEVILKLPKERPVKGRILDQQGKVVVGATVTASSFTAFDSDTSMNGHLKRWVTEYYQRGSPPDGDRGMFFSDGYVTKENPDGRTPYTATTDKDGRFEIAGVGANQLVNLRIHGTGVADKELVCMNRDGFDPAPHNKAAKGNEVKGYSFGGKWVLYGPDPEIVLDPEKIVRGKVTDADGEPRAGVGVVLSRTNKSNLNPDFNQAKTDKDGKYEIRGARKHDGYGVEVDADPKAGLLPCQGFADDTVGYEPITIDIKQAKGVVVTGTVKNKATGEPIPADLFVGVLRNNPFVEKYPPFQYAASMASEKHRADKDGKFRVVTIPGPVIVMVWPTKEKPGEFKPVVIDPKYPDYFTNEYGFLGFLSSLGGTSPVQGCWCKVIEAKATDTDLTVNVELEPATKTAVKVVDADGKPVKDCKATGVTHIDFTHPTEFAGDTLTVFNLEAKKERLLAVVHEKRNLVGTLSLTADTKDPVVKLGSGGSVTGKAVDADGKPLAGLSVQLVYVRREATEASAALKKAEFPVTDKNGDFRIDTLFPGQEFRLFFSRGKARFGPDYDKAAKHTIAKHGDTLKLGDLKLEPSKDGE